MNFTKNAIKYFLGFLFSTYAVFAAESTPVITKAGVQLSVYGFASLTAAYNDSKSNNGNFDNTVSASDLTNEDDGGWYLTPNLTRLGGSRLLRWRICNCSRAAPSPWLWPSHVW